MKRIIQIDESEYNQLADKASLNEKQIEERAINLYKERGVAKIEITVRTKSDVYLTRTFSCDSWVFYKDARFFISEELRDRLRSFITKYVQERINQDYETPQRLMIEYSRQLEFLKIAKYIIYAVALSGWAAFVTLLCMK